MEYKIETKNNKEVKIVTNQKLFNEQAIRCFEFLERFLPANYWFSFENEIKKLKELNETIK